MAFVETSKDPDRRQCTGGDRLKIRVWQHPPLNDERPPPRSLGEPDQEIIAGEALARWTGKLRWTDPVPAFRTSAAAPAIGLYEHVAIGKPPVRMFALEDHQGLDAADSELRAMNGETALVVQRRAFFRFQHRKQASLAFEPLNEGSRALRTIIVEREDVIPGGEHARQEIELELLEELRRMRDKWFDSSSASNWSR